jgi:hypothetical protein
VLNRVEEEHCSDRSFTIADLSTALNLVDNAAPQVSTRMLATGVCL